MKVISQRNQRSFPDVLAPLLSATLLVTATTGRVSAQDGKVVDSRVVQLTEGDFQKLKNLDPEVANSLNRIDLKAITYLSDGLKVKGYLAMPKSGANFPCVIYNRGGSIQPVAKLTDVQAAYKLGRLASYGYLAIASQYRGAAGEEGKDEMGGADVSDVLNLLPLLESVPQADATRIGMYGRSRGGMMTYLALTKSDRITAAIVDAGMADLLDSSRRRPEMEEMFSMLIPNYASNKEAALTARSAVRWPEKLNKKTPILLLHGSADWRVHPTQALTMATKLYECKHPARFVFFEGGDHGLHEHRDEVNRLVKDWLDRYVRDKRPWPSLEPHGE
jgi:dipeptidyl aminopeptidase/acylaminoacyl peptidase